METRPYPKLELDPPVGCTGIHRGSSATALCFPPPPGFARLKTMNSVLSRAAGFCRELTEFFAAFRPSRPISSVSEIEPSILHVARRTGLARRLTAYRVGFGRGFAPEPVRTRIHLKKKTRKEMLPPRFEPATSRCIRFSQKEEIEIKSNVRARDFEYPTSRHTAS